MNKWTKKNKSSHKNVVRGFKGRIFLPLSCLIEPQFNLFIYIIYE